MVNIKGFEMPSSCSKCKFVKLVMPEDKRENPDITCLLTGNKIFDFTEEMYSQYFEGRNNSCLLEERGE